MVRIEGCRSLCETIFERNNPSGSYQKLLRSRDSQQRVFFIAIQFLQKQNHFLMTIKKKVNI